MTFVLIKRPVLYIQSDWSETLRQENGRIWIMLKLKDTDLANRTIHGEIFKTGISQNTIQGTENFRAELVHQRYIQVSHEDPNCNCKYFAPVITFTSIHDKSVASLDVCSGGLGVSACTANTLKVWDSSTGEVRRELQSHVWDVYSCRFFPSGIVVLSGGADMQLKIWSVENGQCAATVTGHTAAITDTAVVERGRNVITTSKDGTARLWDCGQQLCIDVICEADSHANCCTILSYPELKQADVTPGDREIGTEAKLLVVGYENGTVNGVALRSRTKVFELQNSCAVNCCCNVNGNLLFGLQDGTIKLFNIHDTSQLMEWQDASSPVLSLCPIARGFFAGRADGTCTYYEPDSNVTIQLTGPDCDPVYKIATDGTHIYTACRDRCIRKYSIMAAF